MKLLSVPHFFCFLAATLVVAVPQPGVSFRQEIRGSIQGTVTDRQTGRSIPQARVFLTAPSTVDDADTVADSNGRFSFSNLPFGRYRLRASRTAYISSVQNNLALDADRPSSSITISLMRGATIGGRLRDDDDRPMGRVTISAMRLEYHGGVPSLTTAFAERVTEEQDEPKSSKPTPVTNGQGEYLLEGLPPGEYYLRAEYRPGTGSTSVNTTIGARFTYFPGTTDSAAAAPILLREGEDLTGINFRVPTVPNVKVSGNVVVSLPGGCDGAGSGQMFAISQFWLTTRNAAALDREAIGIRNAADRPASMSMVPFELRSVPSGSWDILPHCTRQSGRAVLGRTPIEVRDRDLENLTLDIRPPIELVGRVITGEGVAVPVGNLEDLGVRIESRESIPMFFGSTVGAPRLQPDGTFAFGGLLPGRYAVYLSGLSAGMYLARVRMGAEISDNDMIQVDHAGPELELTIASGATTIEGLVLDRRKRPFSNAAVVLIPQRSRRENPLLYRRINSKTDGRFRLENVVPGDYKVFAWGTAPAGRAEESAQFLAKYEHLGKAVTIRPGVPISDLQLDLIADVP